MDERDGEGVHGSRDDGVIQKIKTKFGLSQYQAESALRNFKNNCDPETGKYAIQHVNESEKLLYEYLEKEAGFKLAAISPPDAGQGDGAAVQTAVQGGGAAPAPFTVKPAPRSGKDSYLSAVTDQFIKDIQNNTAPWMRPWKADEYLRPQNPVTENKYTGINSLFLETVQRNAFKSDDPRWYTFLNIKDNKCHLLKGSKGYPISYYNTVNLDKDGKVTEVPEQIAKSRAVRKLYFVFHASQIEGLPPYVKSPEADRKDTEVIQIAEDILTGSRAKIFHDSINRNYYSPKDDEIHLTAKRTYDNVSDYYCTALHELSHWTSHPGRLNRDITDGSGRVNYGSDKYACEELRAEIASYMICKELGLDFNPQNSVAYLSSWSKEMSRSENELLKACHDAVKIKDYCIAFAGRPLQNTAALERENGRGPARESGR